MKRFFLTLAIALVAVLNVIANDDFDSSKNYQGTNVYAYLGEILDIVDNPGIGYQRFYEYYMFDEERFSGDDYFWQYKHDWNWCWGRDYIHKEALSGKTFVVDSIYQIPGYSYAYAFELQNIFDRYDRCVYIYLTEFDHQYLIPDTEINKFPFLCWKYAYNHNIYSHGIANYVAYCNKLKEMEDNGICIHVRASTKYH